MHLQIVHSVMILCLAKSKKPKNIKEILWCFEVVLGFKINLSKSKLLVGR